MKIYFLIIFFFSFSNLFAQRGYFATDSTMISGIELVNGTDYINSKICRVIIGDKIIEYTPYDIVEYGFNDKKTYVSKDIYLSDKSKKVFLQRLVRGKANLYYYRGKNVKTFFLEMDSTFFIELSRKRKNSYKSRLNEVTSDCSAVSDAIKLVRYNKKSLTKLIERYNSCELKPFPFLRYGINYGYGINKFKPYKNTNIVYVDEFSNKLEVNLNEFSYKFQRGYTVGLFIDNPIYRSDFSFHAELNFSKQRFSYNIKEENNDIDLLISTSCINIPILLRYTYPFLKFRPFFNIGGIFNYHFNNNSALYSADIIGNLIEITKINKSPIYENQLGINLGSGIQYSIDYRRSVFIELRYNKSYGVPSLAPLSNSIYFSNDELQIITGINF